MFKGQSYSGSSFFEFLQMDHGDLIPDFHRVEWSKIEVPHATTVLALVYEDGALMAGDRLATEGYQVAMRDIEKVYKVDDTCAISIAGAAGPAIEMVNMFRLELEHYEKLEGQRLTFEGKANRLSFLLRQNLPAAMQGLVVMPLFAGYTVGADPLGQTNVAALSQRGRDRRLPGGLGTIRGVEEVRREPCSLFGRDGQTGTFPSPVR